MSDISRPSDQSIRDLLPRVGLLPKAISLDWTCYNRPGDVFGKQWEAYQLEYTGVIINSLEGARDIRRLTTLLDTSIYGVMPSMPQTAKRRFNFAAEQWVSKSFRFGLLPCLYRPEQIVLFRVLVKLDEVNGYVDIAFRRNELDIRVVGSFKTADELLCLCAGTDLYSYVEKRGRKKNSPEMQKEVFERELPRIVQKLKSRKQFSRSILAETLGMNVKTLDAHLKRYGKSFREL